MTIFRELPLEISALINEFLQGQEKYEIKLAMALNSYITLSAFSTQMQTEFANLNTKSEKTKFIHEYTARIHTVDLSQVNFAHITSLPEIISEIAKWSVLNTNLQHNITERITVRLAELPLIKEKFRGALIGLQGEIIQIIQSASARMASCNEKVFPNYFVK